MSRQQVTTWRFFSLAMLLFFIAGYTAIAPHAKAATTTWKTFTDPLYGFSFNYPANWILTPERNGSHITLLNPATQTAISPLVTTSKDTPAAILRQNSAIIGATTRAITGRQAVDYFSPYVPGPAVNDHDAASTPLQGRTVILPVANTSGSTNVYTFMLTQPTDPTGKASAAEMADHPTFEAMLDTFTLPAKVTAALSTACPSTPGSITPYCSYGCDAICWADANWNYTKYDDTSSIYCTTSDGYSGGYWTANCGNNNNNYAVQVPGGGPNNPPVGNQQEYFQPNFQCADFVSRSLVQNYQVAGLGNGGVKGRFPATSSIGTYSFQTYRLTYTPYSSDTTYNLILVSSFEQYLLNSGLGTNIGTNVSQIQPGDVIIYYNSNGDYHTMISTSTGFLNNGKWDAYLDGHNASAYHNLLSWWVSANPSYRIIHMRGSLTGSVGQSLLYGSGWTSFTDGYGQASSYVGTTNRTNATAWAQWPDSSETTACAVLVYIPNGHGTANITFGIQMANSSWAYRTVNENNIDGWALLYKWGELGSPPIIINVGNNNGTTNQQMGVGQMAFLC